MEFDDETGVPFKATDFELEPFEGRMGCPYCGSIDVEKLRRCECCGEWTDGELCDECSRKAEAIIKLVQSRFDISTDALDLLIGTYAAEGRWKRS